MIWQESQLPHTDVEALSQELGVSLMAAALLWRIGIREAAAAERFLDPRLADLSDPFEPTHMEEAVDRVYRALTGQEHVVILGDYDADGVTSTVLLVSLLRKLGLSARYFVPRRKEEGYGLTRTAIERILADVATVPDLFIALDCGTNSVEEVAYLRSLGIDVIIVDHHRCSHSKTADDVILVNPHVFDKADSASRDLCTVGLVFKWMHAFLTRLRSEGSQRANSFRLRDSLDLVALGTIADLVPLKGENRVLTRFGLEGLKAGSRCGVQALCRVSGITPGQEISPLDVSFRLGPRINASGRLADASLPVEMLLEEDADLCNEAAVRLDRLNCERQAIEQAMTQAAMEQAKAQRPPPSGIVAYDADWHPGVVGIIAGKLCRHFNRPCIVLTSNGSEIKGSGRSIPQINLIEVLGQCSPFLEDWGGHPMAVGIRLQQKNLQAFISAFDIAVEAAAPQSGLPEASVEIAYWTQPATLDEPFLTELDRLRPFGASNPEPIFGIRATQIVGKIFPFGENGIHFRFRIAVAKRQLLDGIAWRKGNHLPPLGTPVDLAVKFNWNQWNGRKRPQVELVDWRLSQ